jgi:CheY-like chemotaxis protein
MPSILLVADDAWVQNQVRSALSGDSDRVVVSEDPKAVVDLASESPSSTCRCRAWGGWR